MSPINVAILGVGPTLSPFFRVGEWGIQHLISLKASPHYKIVAICNSSVESAQKSIAAHGLDPATVKAYGSPDAVAADPNVQLVVVAVNVKKHVDLAKPIIDAGKDILVEFPLATTASGARELKELADKKGIKTIVGSQAHSNPIVIKLRELLKKRVIGDVVSTSLTGISSISVAQGWPESASQYLDLEGGASRSNIFMGHIMAGFLSVVGDFQTVQSVHKTQVKKTPLLDDNSKPTGVIHNVTSPDTILLQGVLKSGAIASVQLRTVASPVDGEGFRWLISGTEGEIVFTSGPGFFQIVLPDAKIQLRLWAEEKASEVDLSDGHEEDYVTSLEGVAPSIARPYDAFAKKQVGDYATFESALAVQQLLDTVTKNAVWAP